MQIFITCKKKKTKSKPYKNRICNGEWKISMVSSCFEHQSTCQQLRCRYNISDIDLYFIL